MRRSRERRAAASQRRGLPTEIGGRSVPVAAILLATGGPVVGVAAAKALSGGDGDGSGSGSRERAALTVEQAKSTTRAQQPAATTAAQPAAPKPKPEMPALPRQQGAEAPEAAGDTVAAPTAATLRPKVVRVSSTTSKPKPKKATTATKTTKAAKPAAKRGGVRTLQAALGLSADGDFGPTTEKALRHWQREHGLKADGKAGPQTLAALHIKADRVFKRKRPARRHHHTTSTKPRTRLATTHRVRRGGGIKALQAALGLSADGDFGPSTEKALRSFQRHHGLPVDGVAGPATRKALGMGSGKALRRHHVAHHRRHHHSSGGGGGGGGGGSSIVARVVAAANQIATKPYVYGGGHGSFNSAGYDCSGSVSYALHGGGLISSPITSGAFMSYGAPGPGKHISIYANSGHVYMTIDGRRFDTSARSQGGSRWGGPRSGGGGFVVRHPPGL